MRPGQDRLEGAALQADDTRRFGVVQLVQPPGGVVRLLVDVVPTQMETLLVIQTDSGADEGSAILRRRFQWIRWSEVAQ